MGASDGPALRPLAREYTREPCVVQEIAALALLDARERLSRLAVQGAGAPCPETLIYWVRTLRAEGEAGAAWSVIEVLRHRIARTVSARISRIFGLSQDEREELADELGVALLEEWLSDGDSFAFWEVRFNLCLNRKLIDLKQRYQRRLSREIHLSPTEEDDDAGDPIERIADPKAASPEEAAIVSAALDSLPSPLREAYYLKHHAGWIEERIGEYLGCTSRTVRNYLRRAEDHLAPWRDMDVNQ